jgi:hypothetical protein
VVMCRRASNMPAHRLPTGAPLAQPVGILRLRKRRGRARWSPSDQPPALSRSAGDPEAL